MRNLLGIIDLAEPTEGLGDWQTTELWEPFPLGAVTA